MAHVYNRSTSPVCQVDEYAAGLELPGDVPVFVTVERVDQLEEELAVKLKEDAKAVLVLSLGLDYHVYREFFRRMDEFRSEKPDFTPCSD